MNLGLLKNMRHSNDGPAKPTALPVPDAIPGRASTSGHPMNGRVAGLVPGLVPGDVPGNHRRACAAPAGRPGREAVASTPHPPTAHPSPEPVPPAHIMIIIKPGIPGLPYRHGAPSTPTLTGHSR